MSSNGGAGRPSFERRIGRDRSLRRAVDDGAGRAGTGSAPIEADARRFDAHVLETVKYAGVLAEESLVPQVRSRGTSATRGSSSVMIDIPDRALMASFRRQGLLRRCAVFRCWTVDRRWSEAFGDLELDERMCVRVARHLAETFPGRMRTRVVSYLA